MVIKHRSSNLVFLNFLFITFCLQLGQCFRRQKYQNPLPLDVYRYPNISRPYIFLNMDTQKKQLYYLKLIEEDVNQLRNVPLKFKKDCYFLLAAIRINPDVVFSISRYHHFKREPRIFFQSMFYNHAITADVFPFFKKEFNVTRYLVSKISEQLAWVNIIPKKFLLNKAFMKTAIYFNKYLFFKAHRRLKYDKEFVFFAALAGVPVLQYNIGSLNDNKMIVYLSIKNNPASIKNASEHVLFDEKIFEFAFKNDPTIVCLPSYKRDKNLILKGIKQDPAVLKCVAEKFKSDRDVVTTALKIDGRVIKFVSESLRDDPNILALASLTFPGAINYASQRVIDQWYEPSWDLIRYPLSSKFIQLAKLLGLISDR